MTKQHALRNTLMGLCLVAGLHLSACGNSYGCTTEFVPAMSVALNDAAGVPVPNASEAIVEWSDDEGVSWRQCDFFSSNSARWSCGPDAGGRFDVRASLGALAGMETDIRVTAGRCHARQVSVSVVLE